MKESYPIIAPHELPIEETILTLQTDVAHGLSHAETENRNTRYGLNRYESKKQKSLWRVLLRQFQSPIVYLLIFGASVSLYFKDVIEAIAIVVVVLVNACIGFAMEWQARKSMKALKDMDIVLSKVIRDGRTEEVHSEKLTPGDIILLEAGDLVPADSRLVECHQLQCDESSLTGESLPTEKNAAALPKATILAEQLNMVFKGTAVINGNGKAIVTGIAANTQLGTITSLVESEKEITTPLDKKLADLSKKLIWLTLGLTLIFTISGIIEGRELALIIKTSIALAVAAFPEGLPIVATVALAYGMLLMAKRNAIVKDLASVETLGSTSVILTDKTGTLTENKVYVDSLAFPEEQVQLSIEEKGLKVKEGTIEVSKENFTKLVLIASLCNNATITRTDVKKRSLGDPMEIALLHFAGASGLVSPNYEKEYVRINEAAFNSESKIMGTVHKHATGLFISAKGSVEHLLEKCSQLQKGSSLEKLTDVSRTKILTDAEGMASEGLRVLAFAYSEQKDHHGEDYLKELIYVGSIGFLDPPRLDIKGAITICKEAGIKIVMITGDHPLTALNIAAKVGVVEPGCGRVLTGIELPPMESLTDTWKNKILSTTVFARTTPKQKLEIAGVFQEEGNIVAMTGDGVNDAPALKKADVGIAMGIRGTQVAKETASIILKDDSFTSIAHAVAHGREIFQNIQKFVIYLVSCNMSEILVITAIGFIAPAAVLPPLQILFLNMVTDVFPALALGLGKGDKTVMLKPPRASSEQILSSKNWWDIALYAVAMTLAVLLAVVLCESAFSSDAATLNNVAFLTLAFAQLFQVFNMASPTSRLLVNEITKNKFIWIALVICIAIIAVVYAIPQTRVALGLVYLPFKLWMMTAMAGLLPLAIIQLFRFLKLSIRNKEDH